MNYMDEFRNREAVKGMAAQIARVTANRLSP
jgi:hypothetical protein